MITPVISHFIIKYSIAVQKKRKEKKTETEVEITRLNKSLNSNTLNQDEQKEKKKKATRKGISTGENGGKLSKRNFSPVKTRMGYKR